MRRTASEVIRSLESRIARLEADTNNRIALLEKSASIYQLMDDFKFNEGDSPREIARALEQELSDLYQNVSWQVTNAHYEEGQVEFVARISGVVPAEMVPMPWSVGNVLTKLENELGVENLEAQQNHAMVYAKNALLGEIASFLNCVLHYQSGKWVLSVEEGATEPDEVPDSLWSYISRIEFKVKSTGSVSEDVKLLSSQVKRFLTDFKKYRG